MTTVLLITNALLAAAGAMIVIRLLRGPTMYDRLVALDTLIIVLVSAVAVDAARERESANVALLLLVALVGFVTTVAVVRLMPEEEP